MVTIWLKKLKFVIWESSACCRAMFFKQVVGVISCDLKLTPAVCLINNYTYNRMSTLLLIAGALMLSAGVVGAFRHPSTGAMFAFVGLVAMWNSGHLPGLSGQSILFWAIAVMILFGIRLAGGDTPSSYPSSSRYYIAGGALVGMLAGLTLGQSAMIVGSAIGAVVAALAWSRTPAGRSSMSGLWRLTAATGFPAVITMTLVGLAIEQLVIHH